MELKGVHQRRSLQWLHSRIESKPKKMWYDYLQTHNGEQMLGRFKVLLLELRLVFAAKSSLLGAPSLKWLYGRSVRT